MTVLIESQVAQEPPNRAGRPALDDLSIVIINYNGANFLGQCLEVLTTLYAKQVQTIIVLDNASQDNSRNVVRSYENKKLIRWVDSGRNLGYSGGANLAARLTTTPYLVLMNPDVILGANCLEQMRQTMDNQSGLQPVGVVGCCLLYPYEDRSEARIQHVSGKLEYPLALAHHVGAGELESKWKKSLKNDELAGNSKVLLEADYVTGALIMLRREMLDELEGFDERFSPAYYEETDLCWRARAAGWRVVSCLAASSVHYEAGDTGSASVSYYYLFHLNRLRFVLKHYSKEQLREDFLQAEEERYRKIWQYSQQDQSATGSELEALQKVYAELSGLSEPPVPPDIKGKELGGFEQSKKLTLELEQFSNWLALESGSETLKRNWRLLTQPFLNRQPKIQAGKRLNWHRPVQSWQKFREELRVAFYRRLVLPHLLEMSASQERFNSAVVNQLNELVRAVSLIHQQTTEPFTHLDVQLNQSLSCLREIIFEKTSIPKTGQG